MIIADAANSIEAPKVIFKGVVGAMPGNDVEGCVGLSCREKMSVELGEKGELGVSRVVLIERRSGGLEVSSISQAIGANRAKFWEAKVTLVEFKDVASDRTIVKRDVVASSTGNDANFVGPYQEAA